MDIVVYWYLNTCLRRPKGGQLEDVRAQVRVFSARNRLRDLADIYGSLHEAMHSNEKEDN